MHALPMAAIWTKPISMDLLTESHYNTACESWGLDFSEVGPDFICGVAEDWVNGITRPIHIGRSTQVWGIEMVDDQGRLRCVSRFTMSVLSPRR